MHRLEQKYADSLVVVGVHSGKFIAERETDNIRAATWRLGITHPVVNDRHFRTWRLFGVQAWPTIVLVGPDGGVLLQHAGEFSYEGIERVMDMVIDAYTQQGMLDTEPRPFTPDEMPAPSSPLRFPGKVLADPAGGRLFIADTGNNRVLVARLSPDGAFAEVIDTIGDSTPAFESGPFESASLNAPEGMALDGETLYIADTENHAVRAADLRARILRTVAGDGEQGNYTTGGLSIEAHLNSPWDLLVRDGWLYIAMAGTHQLWRLDLRTGEVGPFVGSGRENIDDGPNPRATLAQPSGLATDGRRLFFADSESSAIRAADFSPDGHTQTLVGSGLFEFGDKDGKALQARLEHCLGVDYLSERIYIADTYNNKIKRIDLTTREVTTIYGSGRATDLYEPGGLSISAHDGTHHMYIADTNNHRVVQGTLTEGGDLESVSPLSLT